MECGFWRGSLQRQIGGVETVKPIRADDPGLHPSLRRRVGAAAEILLLWGAFAAIWICVCSVLVGAVLR
jgi:hypothetical protein